MNFQFSQFKQDNQRLINTFYKRNKQNVRCDRNDSIYIVSSKVKESRTTSKSDDEIALKEEDVIAAVVIRSLAHSKGCSLLLRSLFVLPQYRNLKLGSQLTDYAIKAINSDLFCLCQSELVPFYERLGFNQALPITGNKIEDIMSFNRHKNVELNSLVLNKTVATQIKKGLCLMHNPSQL